MSEICGELHKLFSGLEHFRFPFVDKKIPQNGVYVLFEKGELGHEGHRIVRAGTHTGINQLPSRLKQHFIKENKDRSIFRKNIGRALLNQTGDPYAKIWEYDTTTREDITKYGCLIDHDKQKQIEKKVTTYIQESFAFCVFPMKKKEDRLFWEARIISTVSWCRDCKPSADWLGNYSPKEKIRESGLWLVNELYKEPLNQVELDKLCQWAI